MLWLTKGVSIRLLTRTAGCTWVRCCSGRTVRNSESLRGLRCTLQERWGRGKARALLGPLAVRTYRTGVKALLCPKPCGRERRLCRVQSRADERTRTKALSGQSRADSSEGFVGPKLSWRADSSEGFVGAKLGWRADRPEGQAKMGVILALRR